MDTQTDRFLRALNRHRYPFNYNINNNNSRRTNYVQQKPASTAAPAAPLAIPSTSTSNKISLTQITTVEVIDWLRSRDK